MHIYHFDLQTGAFLGEGVADPNPLEEGKWLIPAGAVATPPEECAEGSFPRWDGQNWQMEKIPEPEPVEKETPAQPETPPLTLEELKAIKREAVEAERDRRRYGILTVDGVRYDADREGRTNMTGRAVMCAAGLASAEFVWRDADNISRTHTPASFLALCVAIDEQTEAIYQVSWVKKAELEQLTDAEAVETYDVSAGWPR